MVSTFTMIVDVLSIVVGIFGVVSISVVGVQYLMAGSDEVKVEKSKRRMFEIIAGVLIYAVFYVVSGWIHAWFM